jgi:hypothetical protein
MPRSGLATAIVCLAGRFRYTSICLSSPMCAFSFFLIFLLCQILDVCNGCSADGQAQIFLVFSSFASDQCTSGLFLSISL